MNVPIPIMRETLFGTGPRFKAARAQKIFVVKGLIGCAGKPDEKDPRGKGIKTGDQAIQGRIKASFSYIGGDQHREG
jgi:hypothetical protein